MTEKASNCVSPSTQVLVESELVARERFAAGIRRRIGEEERKNLRERAALAACDAISEYGRPAHTVRPNARAHRAPQRAAAAGRRKISTSRESHIPALYKDRGQIAQQIQSFAAWQISSDTPRSPNLSLFGSKLTSKVSQERGYHWCHSQLASDTPWMHAAS